MSIVNVANRLVWEQIQPIHWLVPQDCLSFLSQCVSSEDLYNDRHRLPPQVLDAATAIGTSQGWVVMDNSDKMLAIYERFKTGTALVRHPIEIARLRFDDTREKVLFFSAEATQNNGFMNPQNIQQLLVPLFMKYDLKYQIAPSLSHICAEIQKVSEMYPLAHVFIHALGSAQEEIILKDEEGEITEKMDSSNDFSHCFEGVKTNGKIFLLSAYSGSGKNNLAQKIANQAKRIVVAPIDLIRSDLMTVNSIEVMNLYHPEYRGIEKFNSHFGYEDYMSDFYARQKNIFKEFHPELKIRFK